MREILEYNGIDKNELDDRYRILFSFENIYGIFCAKENVVSRKSIDYCLVSTYRHDSAIPIDVLKDIEYLVRIGEMKLNPNDIICIRINGLTISYSYSGTKTLEMEHIVENYVEIPGFLTEEKEKFICSLHKENKVLSVLDGMSYFIHELDLKKQAFFCIDKEVYNNESWSCVMTDYSLYVLQADELQVKKVNPYPRPFPMIGNALYYYKKHSGNNAILLLDRYELEMIKDYYQLQQIIV